MSNLTAVELGADICALARTSVRSNGAVHVSDAETLDPAAFPGGGTFTLALRQSRRKLKLPRRCRVVLWGMPDGASRKDVAVKPLLQPLEGAGFRVERVVSPANALAALARLKTSRGENATCWLAINRGGVAIVVVRPGKQLYAHSFIWDSTIGATGSQARLLQRYSLVSMLAPEVRRAMAVARQHGTPVDAIVTCGNLPDMRSMTMPLIEELDVEVETLDSLDGLEVKKQDADRLADIAPAIRLACAGVVARGSRPWDQSRRRKSRLERALLYAAVLGGVLAVGYAWYAKLHAPAPPPFRPPVTAPVSSPDPRTTAAKPPVSTAPVPPPVKRQTPAPAPTSAKPQNDPRSSTLDPRTTGAKPPVSTAPVPPPVKPQTPASPPTSAKPQNDPPASAGASTSAKATVDKPAGKRSSTLDPRTTGAKPPVSTAPVPPPVKPQTPASPPTSAKPQNDPPASAGPTAGRRTSNPDPRTINSPAVPADKSGAGRTSVPAASNTAPAASAPPKNVEPKALPPLLRDPLPKILTILVSGDRRYATVDGGQIVGIGDILGRRTIVAIDERSVVLREPSGVQIRVGLGGRLLGVGPGDR
jgi:hypothetical protein